MTTPVAQIIRSRAEIELLKAQWTPDPHWDIEDTPGFEAHRADLLQFRLEKERQWKSNRDHQLLSKSIQLGIPGNIKLTLYIEKLEAQIKSLGEQLDMHLNRED